MVSLLTMARFLEVWQVPTDSGPISRVWLERALQIGPGYAGISKTGTRNTVVTTPLPLASRLFGVLPARLFQTSLTYPTNCLGRVSLAGSDNSSTLNDEGSVAKYSTMTSQRLIAEPRTTAYRALHQSSPLCSSSRWSSTAERTI